MDVERKDGWEDDGLLFVSLFYKIWAGQLCAIETTNDSLICCGASQQLNTPENKPLP